MCMEACSTSLWHKAKETIITEGRLESTNIGIMMEDLIRGIRFIHDRLCVAHGELSPANALVGRDGRVKIADFGGALAPQHHATPSEAMSSSSLNRFGAVLRAQDFEFRS